MTDIIDNYLGTHARALTVRSQRASLLANNMANADTPNYKAQDINFRETLKQQMVNAGSGSKMNMTHSNHIPLSSGLGSTNPVIQFRVPNQASLDGNTVDTDIENGQFSDNAVRYQASLHFLNKRITGLIGVLRGE